jgi:hypothetical protein
VPAGESDDAIESKLPLMTAVEEQIERSRVTGALWRISRDVWRARKWPK